MDSSLLFFILFLACLWLVLNEFFGTKYIEQFLAKLVPSWVE